MEVWVCLSEKKNTTACEVINNELLLRNTSVSKGKNVLQNASCICTDEIIKISTFEIRGYYKEEQMNRRLAGFYAN